VNLKELHRKKIKKILDERHVLNLPLIEKEADFKKVFSVLTGRDHVWVVDEKGSKKLVGLITESDVLNLVAPSKLPKYAFGWRHGISLQHGTVKTASDIMHKQLCTCSSDDTVGEVLSRMVDAGIRRLPVVKKDEIAGEITIRYILQLMLGKR
jgi:predicted transcriptional regulator